MSKLLKEFSQNINAHPLASVTQQNEMEEIGHKQCRKTIFASKILCINT